MIGFIGLAEPWRARTAGERLLFLILARYQEWPILRKDLARSSLAFCRRYDNFSDFFVGSLALHILQRLVMAATATREAEEERLSQTKLLRNWIVGDMGLSPLAFTGDVAELVDEALRCAEVASRNQITASMVRGVKASAPPDQCYSCGNYFGVPDPGKEELCFTCDHIWPASLGGDTAVENLLPACQFCNRTKGNIAAWQMGWIQPGVYATGFGDVPKALKLGLHMRAAVEFAHNAGGSLKDAFLAMGPRLPIAHIDPNDSFDFFNMRVHDEKATAVSWSPR